MAKAKRGKKDKLEGPSRAAASMCGAWIPRNRSIVTELTARGAHTPASSTGVRGWRKRPTMLASLLTALVGSELAKRYDMPKSHAASGGCVVS